MSSIKIKDLKSRLGEMDRGELIQLICKLHKSSKEVQNGVAPDAGINLIERLQLSSSL